MLVGRPHHRAEFDAVPFFLAESPETINALLDDSDDRWVQAPRVGSFMADLHYDVWNVQRKGEERSIQVVCEVHRSEMQNWLNRYQADELGRMDITSLERTRA